jgi:subtilisin-like proprotein convertase family protein
MSKHWMGALALWAGLTTGVPALAATPTKMAVQGALANVAGGAVTDGQYIGSFGLYKEATGGTPLWVEGPVLLQVKQGQFSITLGEKAELTAQVMAQVGATAWLGVKIEPDPELPRVPLASVPFALRAGVAEGVDCSGCIGGDALDPKFVAGLAKTTDLGAYAKAADLNDYAKTSVLGAYAKTADLNDYAKTADLGAYAKAADLGAYAKAADLGAYAKAADLGAYAKAADLGAYAKTADLGAYAKAADLGAYAKTADLGAYAKAADLGAYAKTADLGAYAKTADLGAYAKAADLGAYAKAADLGAYAKAADLGAYAKTAGLATVATSGKYSDLAGAPTLAKLGTACGTGLVVKGLQADGSLDCVAAGGSLKPDDLAVVSNSLLTNTFGDVFTSTTVPMQILDNNPVGSANEITVPDVGTVQKLTISVDLTNSDISTVEVYLYDPANVEYLLYSKSGSKGAALKASWPPTTLVKGDLSGWVGKNPKGKWRLQVIDTGFANNQKDGQLTSWSVQLGTLSTKKVAVNGALQLVAHDVAPVACDATQFGTMWTSVKDKTLYVCNGTEYYPLPLTVPGSQASPGVTCKDIQLKAPASKDGTYWIDPDGQGGLAAFQVFCDMSTSGGGWTRIDESTDYAYKIYTEGQSEAAFKYALSDAQIDAIKSKSSEARQAWSCHTVGVGNAYDLRNWPKTQIDTYAACWATNNSDEKLASGTDTTFAAVPYRSWFPEDCGDPSEACQHNVDHAFFR